MMALVALFAVLRGRPISKWTCLATGSVLALMLDPFLVGSVGFLLSVSACIGMALMGEALTVRLRGPYWLRRAVGFSLGAQAGVLPVQFIVFRQVPAVGLITNIAAEPLAALVMMWGVVGGVVAGLVPGHAVRFVLHLPDAGALWLVSRIAEVGSYCESHRISRVAAFVVTFLMLVALWENRSRTTVDVGE
jgi:predicted membrane metal-binding protein